MEYLRYSALVVVLALFSQSCAPIVADKENSLENNGVLSTSGVQKFEHARRLLDHYRGRTSQLEDAKVALTQVLNENPSYAPAYRELARYVIMRGHINSRRFHEGTLEAAESTLNQAIEIDPEYADAYVLYGHLYRLMNRYQEAKEALDKADRLGSKLPWLHINWADIHIDEGRHEEAAKRYKKILESGTKNRKAVTAAFEGLIKYYKATNQLDEADRMYRENIAADPNSAWNFGNYAEFLLCTRDQYDSAIARAREALQRMNYGVGQFFLASALYRKWAQLVVNEHRPQDGQPYFLEAESIYSNVWYVAANVRQCPTMIVVQQALQIAPPAANRPRRHR